MKPVLGMVGVLALVLGVLFLASPSTANALLGRAVGFLDPAPVVRAEALRPPSARPAGAAPGEAEPEWRLRDRAGWRAYEAGDFETAAAAWTAVSGKAPAADSVSLRERADRANVYRLLSEGFPAAASADPAADEAEVRRRIEGLAAPTAGSWLDIADFAASRGLRSHLAFLYEKAFEGRNSSGGDAVPKRVTRALQARKASGSAPPPEVLASVIRELPTSEAADIARIDTGGVLGGVVKRGEGRNGHAAPTSPEDMARLEDARKLMLKGDAEYKLAVPGFPQVNQHRRAALDAFSKARDIYDAVDAGRGSYTKQIHDCNRNIAELRKDLPIGK